MRPEMSAPAGARAVTSAARQPSRLERRAAGLPGAYALQAYAGDCRLLRLRHIRALVRIRKLARPAIALSFRARRSDLLAGASQSCDPLEVSRTRKFHTAGFENCSEKKTRLKACARAVDYCAKRVSGTAIEKESRLSGCQTQQICVEESASGESLDCTATCTTDSARSMTTPLSGICNDVRRQEPCKL